MKSLPTSHPLSESSLDAAGLVGVKPYVTVGGTIVLASPGYMNDDGLPHDLAAVLPLPIESESRVVALRPTLNPDFLDALRRLVDGEVHAR
ncbi:hypothetical protein [Gordonia sp. MMO-8]|uniref:hypothetical protein n=1 Tax=Gordonia sp. MMO-8 TaxID=3127886 RepID=UPI003019F968